MNSFANCPHPYRQRKDLPDLRYRLLKSGVTACREANSDK
jgi:hypothetical protein